MSQLGKWTVVAAFLLFGWGMALARAAAEPDKPSLAEDQTALARAWVRQVDNQTEMRLVLDDKRMRITVIKSVMENTPFGVSRGKDITSTILEYELTEKDGKRTLTLFGQKAGKPNGSLTCKIDGVKLTLSGSGSALDGRTYNFSGDWLRQGAAIPKKGEAITEAGTLQTLKTLEAELGRDDKAPGNPIVQVLLNSTAVMDANLEWLKVLPAIRVLGLTDTAVTDNGLPFLKDLPALETLSLRRTQISDAGLVHLKALKWLKHVSFQETRISDEGLPHLAGCAVLTELDLLDQGDGRGPGASAKIARVELARRERRPGRRQRLARSGEDQNAPETEPDRYGGHGCGGRSPQGAARAGRAGTERNQGHRRRPRSPPGIDEVGNAVSEKHRHHRPGADAAEGVDRVAAAVLAVGRHQRGCGGPPESLAQMQDPALTPASWS